jgi:protein arginine kinase activator
MPPDRELGDRNRAMICQSCKKAVATVHLTEINEGEKNEVHLCDACAHKKGMMSSFSLSNLVSELAGGPATGPSAPEGVDPVESASCEQCGMSYREFRSGGRLGCSHDYDAFRAGLGPLLERIHGATQHVGKVPASMGDAMVREKELIDLRRELQKVIQSEEYERAAELRDRIRQLEESEDTDGD